MNGERCVVVLIFNIPDEHEDKDEDKKKDEKDYGEDAGTLAVGGRNNGDSSSAEFLTIEDVGVNHRNKGKRKKNDQHSGKGNGFRQKGCDEDKDAADDPEFACEAVCMVPVFFIKECPLDFDADGTVLTAFWEIVAEDDEHKSEHDRGKVLRVDFAAESGCVDESGAED